MVLILLIILVLNVDAFNSRNFIAYKARSITYLNMVEESLAVDKTVEYLNDPLQLPLVRQLVSKDIKLKKDMDKSNFWTGGSFKIESTKVIGIKKEAFVIDCICNIRDKLETRRVEIPFEDTIDSENSLKQYLLNIAYDFSAMNYTSSILNLDFGNKYGLPKDFLFNNVPHPAWVRNYIYDAAAQSLCQAVIDDTIPPSIKSRMTMYVNFPECNPAFDTYRLGTILEMVRSMALVLVQEGGLKVRICVQGSMGEGIFTGMPLSIASMRPVLERMDWNLVESEAPKRPNRDGSIEINENALIRFGKIGDTEISDDDDCIIAIAPQNIVGASIIPDLKSMTVEAERRGIPLITINPNLIDKPSSNNNMQIRGRSERMEFAKSFTKIFHLQLLYPSGGGYMYPIRGMVMKKSYHEPWVCYDRIEKNSEGYEIYKLIAGFPNRIIPDSTMISNQFTR